MAITEGRADQRAFPYRIAALARLLCSGAFLLLAFGSVPAGSKANPLTIMPPHPRVAQEIQAGAARLPPLHSNGTAHPNPAGALESADSEKLSGPIRTLAVLVSFSDRPATTSASFFDRLIFAPPGPEVSSVRSYYAEVSYNQVDIVTVNLPSSLGWMNARRSEAYYAGGNYCLGDYPHNCQKLAEEVVDAVASRVDFSQYDNNHDGYAEPILIVHAGQGAEYTASPGDIWSHSWSLENSRAYDGVQVSDYVIMPEYWQAANKNSSDMTIGVFAHEMAHGFWRVPDLYDTDYSSEGIGSWSLMAAGAWNGPAGMGSSPAWPDAWTRIRMGFVAPIQIDSVTDGLLIPEAFANPARPTVFKIHDSSQGAQEYYLLENRQQDPASYDRSLPGSGLLIWHVDEAAYGNGSECRITPNCACGPGNHYTVSLEQADGLQQLEKGWNQGDSGDPFPGAQKNHAFTPDSHPDSGSWYSCAPGGIRIGNIGASGPWITAGADPPPSVDHLNFLPVVGKGMQ